MNSIFYGMILLFLDFNIDIGASRIGLIPDFLGYIFILRGTSELLSYSPRFQKIKPFTTTMIVYTAILYVLDLIGFSNYYFIGIVFGLVAFVFSLYISYQIVSIAFLVVFNGTRKRFYSSQW